MLYSNVSSTGIVIVKRPSVQQSIAVHSAVGDDNVVLDPLPPTPPPPKDTKTAARCSNLQGKWSCPNQPGNCTIEKTGEYEFELSHGGGKTTMRADSDDINGWDVEEDLTQNWSSAYATTTVNCTALIFTNDYTMWTKH